MSKHLSHLGLTLAAVLLVTWYGTPAGAAEVTEQQAIDLALRIEEAMNEGDGSVLDAAIDLDVLGDRTAAGLNARPEIIAGFKKGLSQQGLGTQIARQLGDGTCKFLRVRGTPEDRRILFRITHEQGNNYLEMYLASQNDGEPRVVDLYNMITGELISQTLRRLLLPIVAEAKKGRVARLVKGEADFVKHIDDIQRLSAATYSNQPEEALRIYDSLPESLRNEKVLMLQRMINAARIDDELYRKAIAEYEALFPDDPSGLLIRIDGLFLSGEYDKLLENLEKLDKEIGGDPYLDLYRGNTYVAKGDKATGKKYLSKLLKAEPENPDSYYALIELALEEEDFKETARLLTLAEKNANVRFDAMDEAPVYAKFLKSPEYGKWAKVRAKQPAAQPAEVE